MALVGEAYSAEAFRALGHAWIDRLADGLGAELSRATKVLPTPKPTPELLAQWQSKLGALDNAVAGGADPLALLGELIAGSTRLHHPGNVGHQVSVTLPLAALAEAAAGMLNNSLSIFEMGPAGAMIEQAMVRWMATRLGLGEAADGTFVSGGSLANLMGLLAARHERAGFGVWREGAHAGPPLCALVSGQAHYSSARGAQLMGWGEAGLVKVPCDERFRLRVDELAACKAAAERAGRKVVAVIASACSTATGSFDPLEPIADFCERHGLWLHVDGAHGAAAVLSPRHRAKVAGIERADSVAWDAHKLLMMPSLSTGIVYRDGAVARRIFAQDASYLFVDDAALDLGQRTLECTKRMLATPLFLCLATYGEAFFAEHVANCFDISARFGEHLAAQPDFELATFPECNIVCFRHLPEALRAAPVAEQNRHQLAIRERVLAAGAFYLVQTTLNGITYLRTTILHPLTTFADLCALLDELRRVG